MARTHTFKGSNFDFGYYAFIENDKLVIGEERGREGGILFSGTYEEAKKQGWINRLWRECSKLSYAIDEYYSKEVQKQEAEEKTVTKLFKDSREPKGDGWYAFIESDQLVIGYSEAWYGRHRFRGTYDEAAERGWLATLLREDQKLYHEIDKYFIKHGAEPKVPIKEKTTSPAGVLWKVKLYMANTEAPIIYVLVRGLNEACVINKLFPKVPEVLTLQTHDARVIAVRSDKISAAEFMPED